MNNLLEVLGHCDARVFGLTLSERLRRQRGDEPGPLVVVRADIVLSDETMIWLLENPDTVMATGTGRLAAVAVAPGQRASAVAALQGAIDYPQVNPSSVPDIFIRKLRRRSPILVHSVLDEPPGRVERQLFRAVYKGITDVVTKFVWPIPAFLVTKLCASAGIRPNSVTLVGIAAALATAWFWFQGELAIGLVFAWLMTFLDTVDGKLARVTVTSSWLGNKLDHLTDVIHPPIWWTCLAVGINQALWQSARNDLVIACAVILSTYVIGRVTEMGFKKAIGYNAYMWQPFDSWFRLILSRRNIILAIVTVGVAIDEAFEAFMVAAVWSLISVAIQCIRFYQARQAARSGNARSWLM